MKTQTIFSDPRIALSITSAINRRSQARGRMGWARALVQWVPVLGKTIRFS